jgi:hypothetical protein
MPARVSTSISVFLCDGPLLAANAVSSSDGFWRLAKRTAVIAPSAVFAMLFMLAWGYLYYNVVLMHIVGA